MLFSNGGVKWLIDLRDPINLIDPYSDKEGVLNRRTQRKKENPLADLHLSDLKRTAVATGYINYFGFKELHQILS